MNAKVPMTIRLVSLDSFQASGVSRSSKRIPIPVGERSVVIEGMDLSFDPKIAGYIDITLIVPENGSALLVWVDRDTITSDGFTVLTSAAPEIAGYEISVEVHL